MRLPGFDYPHIAIKQVAVGLVAGQYPEQLLSGQFLRPEPQEACRRGIRIFPPEVDDAPVRIPHCGKNSECVQGQLLGHAESLLALPQRLFRHFQVGNIRAAAGDAEKFAIGRKPGCAV